MKFNLDESNVIDFHVFKVELNYRSQSDNSTRSFSFFTIDALEINSNRILFSDFCEHLVQYHNRFKEVLDILIRDIHQSKVSEDNHKELLKNKEYRERKNKVLSFIN